MELVKLLARELVEWPEHATMAVQDDDGQIKMAAGDEPRNRNGQDGTWIRDKEVFHEIQHGQHKLATDHATAIVTRADWEAEKARIAGEVDGGWKRHKGVKQPVADGVKVEIRTRGGDFDVCSADGFAWGANGAEQIMAWRLHNPTEQPAPKPCADPVPAVLVNPPDGPLEWRDRIRTLDTQRAELEATYQRQIGEIDGEREGLVGKLASEGLSLVEVVQLVEDMSDWRNWKVGDLVEVVYRLYGHKFNIGEVVRMKCLPDDDGGRITCEFEDGSDWWSLHQEECKWHSRPGK